MATGVLEYQYTGFGNYDVLTRTQWANILHKQVQDKLYFNKRGFIGPDMGAEDNLDNVTAWYPVVQKTELGRDGGDKIVMPLLRQLTGAGKTGNSTLKDTTSEEALDFWAFNVWIELLRNGAGWQHKMSPQRNKFHTKQVVANLLTDWMAQKMDDSVFNTFINGYSAHVVTETGVSNTAHPNAYYGGDGTSEDDVDVTDVFNTDVLERMAVWAEDNNINPIRMPNGEEGFVALIHPYQLHTLRMDENWRTAQQHANVRGASNPIFNRAEGEYAGVFVHCTKKVTNPASTVADYLNKRQSICMGAHSVARAIGQRPQIIKRDDTDYGRLSIWAIDGIWGDSRADWASDDGESSTSNQSSSRWTTYAENPVSA